ncbi:MAG: hypothetical protein IKX97_07670 [Erysipelotrichaceae bacterium]|nr:hypothetical protein [Erysipelotrichaceae bacterium]MBR5755676.1 hypothetical protein [Erysipelotrichaceae bacterium]
MKCVYCGKEYGEGGTTIKVSNGTFDVCSNECKKLTREYLEKDERYKTRSYLLIFCGSVGFILSTFVFTGTYKLVPMYIGMIIMGISLIVYPYIFSSFITFTRHPIKKMTLMVRIMGLVIAVLSLWFLIAVFRQV